MLIATYSPFGEKPEVRIRRAAAEARPAMNLFELAIRWAS